MKLETFKSRIENGKCNSLVYAANGKEGLISVWKHEGSYILTWEECLPGQQYDEAEYTRDDRRVFCSVDELIEHLRAEGVDPERFTP
jgi:hypothetical protein